MASLPLTDLRAAIVLDPSLAPGFLINRAAVIAGGLAHGMPRPAEPVLTDRTGRAALKLCELPLPILQATTEGLTALLMRALPAPEGGSVVVFPRFAASIHDAAAYAAEMAGRDLAEEPLDGLGLVGPAKWVRSLTGSLKLLR